MALLNIFQKRGALPPVTTVPITHVFVYRLKECAQDIPSEAGQSLGLTCFSILNNIQTTGFGLSSCNS